MYASMVVDTCSYLRLAQSIVPLLKEPFCENSFALGVIKDLYDEYKKSPTLKNKFGWVDQDEYVKNRQRCFKISRDQKTDISNAFFFIRETVREERLTTGRIDIIALAHAYILEFPIVTDDKDLLILAKEYEVEALNTLKLLKKLLDCNHIDLAMIRAIAEYWIHLNDTPASYRKDYKKLFEEDAPR